MSKIVFEHIDKVYDNGFQAVYDFNLEVESGEFVVFVGPSGCGKSTMIRIIAGLEAITEGKIYFDGELMNSKPPNARGIAMVFQSYALYPHLNVAENMAFALTLEGYDEDFIEKRVKEVAAILGLENLLDRKPRQLSGGQCQRVAVGRAIIRHPKVFLMDEPLSNLDAKQRVTMRAEIIEIHRRTKATTIYVTHDQVEAMTMADRIVVICDGRIQQSGTPRQLYFEPANKFVASFLGDPPMNFADCTIQNGRAVIDGTDIAVDLKRVKLKADAVKDGQKVFIGFRPEAVKIGKLKDSAVFSAVSELSELLGDSANVYADMGEYKITLKVLPEAIIKPDTTISFSVDYNDIYLFDQESQEVLNDYNEQSDQQR